MLRFILLILLVNPLLAREVASLKLPDGQRISLEIARTDSERQKGLSNREKLDSASGMLFVYSQSQVVKMWMKECSLPLDMIFMDEHGTINHIHENAIPFSLKHITSPSTTKYVLEVNSGMVKKHKIKLDQKIEIKF